MFQEERVNAAERPNTLDDTIEETNPILYPNMMYVSSATAERSFIAMRRHGDKNKTLDTEGSAVQR